ncbi:hypothetical protein ACIRN5_23470, partial [Lysinibacillus fusiformis]|uniref:hypothetical protein n=2 Tax=Bacillati TaxID=1783272 RepID=UPI0037F38E75
MTSAFGCEFPHAGPPPESKLFHPDEPVFRGRPLLAGVDVPTFGRTDRWPFAAVRRPANTSPGHWVAVFTSFPDSWNLRTRELLMALLNPQHPALINIGAELSRAPVDLKTVQRLLSGLRTLIGWAHQDGLSPHPARWTAGDMHRFIADKRQMRSPAAVRHYVEAVRLLHGLSPALTGGGLAPDPWPGRSRRAIAKDTRDTSELTTPNIRPEAWFPLVKAAWTY